MFNFSTRRVGGIRFIRIGRITITLCLSAAYRPIKQKAPRVPKGWGVIEA